MKRFFIAAALAAMAFVSCDKNEAVSQVSEDGSRQVEFTFSGLYTLTTKADPIADGKYVGIYAGAPISKDNVQMTVAMETATSGTLTPTTTNSLLWGVGQTTEATKFLAVYPYETTRPLVGDDEATKYIEYAVQDGAESVSYANVFLTAAASQAPGTDAEKAKVALEMKHPFAKLVYNITNNSDDFVASASISGIHRNGHLSFATGAVTATGEAENNVALIANGENSWMTVVMPEEAAVNPTVKLTMTSGATYTFVLSAGVALQAGKVYTAAITISGSHGAEVSDRTVLGTFSVTDWAEVDAGAMNPDSNTNASAWWYITGNIDDVSGTVDQNWNKSIPFKCVSATDWQVDFYYAGTNDPATNGFKLILVGDTTTWYGMSPSNNWVINTEDVKAEGAEDPYLVHSLTSADGNVNIAMNNHGKFRIRFTPSESKFYLYKLD